MESGRLFPEGMEQAIQDLLAASYSIKIFRYAGETEYRAEVGINELTSLMARYP